MNSILCKTHHIRTDATVAEMIHPNTGFKIASFSEPKWGAENWYHSDYELILVKKGIIRIGIGDYFYEAGQGSYFFVDSNQPHYIDVNGCSDFLWNAILFDPSVLGGNSDSCRLFLSENTFSTELIPTENTEYLFNSIHTCIKEQRPGFQFEAKSYLSMILCEMIKSGRFEKRKKINPYVKYANLVNNIINYIQDNVSDEITVSGIADKFNYSNAHISRVFKSYTGNTILQFVLDLRIDMSKKLLANSTFAITDISSMCGFGNLSYFTRTFTKKTGISPSEYRRTLTDNI